MTTAIDRIHEIMSRGDPDWEMQAVGIIIELYGGPEKFVMLHLTLYNNIAREVLDSTTYATRAKVEAAMGSAMKEPDTPEKSSEAAAAAEDDKHD